MGAFYLSLLDWLCHDDQVHKVRVVVLQVAKFRVNVDIFPDLLLDKVFMIDFLVKVKPKCRL